ncbi:MAG: hypothetical protein V8S72_00180 [Oscillospiraceae bacterium]
MLMTDLIAAKRDGGKLSAEEIDFMVQGYTKGEIPDYQMSAMCMAILLRGMDDEETLNLTMSMMLRRGARPQRHQGREGRQAFHRRCRR